MSIGEFFGFGGYKREIEGYLSWQHLVFVSVLASIMIFLAFFLGNKYKNKDIKKKNKVLIVSAIIIDSVEIFKIIIMSVRANDPFFFRLSLPLFMCSVQLLTIPLAAFSKGRIKEASLDFVMIFGIVGSILGTYGSSSYGFYPVISLDNVVSGITHCVAGFSSIYIMVSGMYSMKKSNIAINFCVLGCFCTLAYIANLLTGGNYMFLMHGGKTLYNILFELLGGHPVFYPLGVVGLFVVYIIGFYIVFYKVKKRESKKHVEKSLSCV